MSKKKTYNKKNLNGLSANIKKSLRYEFLEFLVICIFPNQLQTPKFTITKLNATEIVCIYFLQNWQIDPFTLKMKTIKNKTPIQVIIKIDANSIEEAKNFLTLLNIPH